MDFKSIKKIPYSEKIILENSEKGYSIPPKTKMGLIRNTSVVHNECAAYLIKNCTINSQSTSIYVNDNKTLYYDQFSNDKTFKYNSSVIIKHNQNKAKIRLLNIDKSQPNGIFLGGTYIWNYYHFLIEIVSKVLYLEKLPEEVKKIPLLFDNCLEEITSFKEITDLFFSDYKIQFINSKKSYNIENLWYITYPNTSPFNILNKTKFEASYTKTRPQTINHIREKAFANLNLAKIGFKHPIDRIFISRKSKTRNSNEDEIFGAVKKFGFKKVFFEDLNFHEQVYIMKNANFIIGATGAAWTNVIFAKENAKGLIWMGDVWGDFSAFSNLAKIVNFDLNYYIYENNSNNFHSDFQINPEIIEQKTKELIY